MIANSVNIETWVHLRKISEEYFRCCSVLILVHIYFIHLPLWREGFEGDVLTFWVGLINGRKHL